MSLFLKIYGQRLHPVRLDITIYCSWAGSHFSPNSQRPHRKQRLAAIPWNALWPEPVRCTNHFHRHNGVAV